MRVNDLPPMRWNELIATLQGKTERKVANNTTLRHEGHYMIVKLHATDIIALDEYGNIFLDTGGWNTVTTASRFKSMLHGIIANVSMAGGSCTVTMPNGDIKEADDINRIYIKQDTY